LALHDSALAQLHNRRGGCAPESLAVERTDVERRAALYQGECPYSLPGAALELGAPQILGESKAIVTDIL
jgi:hypothetical protein